MLPEKTAPSGIWAFAHDRVVEMLLKYPDEKLYAMAPPPKKQKKKRSKKVKGF